jgi:hypothetical protein
MGPSPTGRGPADRAGLVVLDRVDLAVLGRVGLAVLGRAGLGRAGLGRAGPVDPVDLGDQGMDPVVLDRVDPVDRVDIRGLADRAGLAVLDRAGPVDLVDLAGLGRAGPVDLGDQGMDPAGLVDPAGLDPAGRVDPADRADPVDRRRTHPGVRTSGVALRWVAPGMRRTASAHPTTVRRLHRDNMDSAGMVGLLPERRRRSGTGRRPRVAGAVRRLPVVGTAHGMVRRVTGATRSVISGRSITTATTRSRCSIRYSADGASGSSESGFRCTDTT